MSSKAGVSSQSKSLKEIGKRAQQARADTFLIFDTHWLSNFGFHINANDRHAGSYTSHEAPHMIQDRFTTIPAIRRWPI